MNNNNNHFLYIDDDNNFIINLNHENGKLILMNILCLYRIEMNKNKKNQYPLLVILENAHNVYIREKLFNSAKNNFEKDVNNKTFQKLLRCFTIIDKHQYYNLTKKLASGDKKFFL